MAQKSVASFLESMTGLSVSFLDGLGQPVVFRAYDVDVELDVVAHDVGRLGEVLVKFGQHLRERMPVLLGALRCDAVDLGRSVRDGEAIRLYDAVST